MNYSSMEYDDLIPEEPSDLIVSVIFSCYVLYAAAIIIGIPCNVFVLFRMRKLARKCSDVYSNGAGLCLYVMAVADIGSLCAILVQYILSISTESFSVAHMVQPQVLSIICKITAFSLHISTFVSIWSWLLMSTLRYLSVYHPLLYITLWKIPFKVMLCVVCSAFLFNFWLLFAVVNDPMGGCTMTSVFSTPFLNKAFLLLESVGSFVIPTLVIFYVDICVLFGLRFRLFATEMTTGDNLRKNVSPRQVCKKTNHFLVRWLVIALIDVALNAPENLSRLAIILGFIEYSDSEIFYIYRITAQVPYYLQFGFNGVYLALFIYDKSTRPARIRIVGGSSKSNKEKDVEIVMVDSTATVNGYSKIVSAQQV